MLFIWKVLFGMVGLYDKGSGEDPAVEENELSWADVKLATENLQIYGDLSQRCSELKRIKAGPGAKVLCVLGWLGWGGQENPWVQSGKASAGVCLFNFKKFIFIYF